MIEQAFLDRLEKETLQEEYSFTTSEHEYNLLFYRFSGAEMYQVNVEFGTERLVKRRPERPVSTEDIPSMERYEELKPLESFNLLILSANRLRTWFSFYRL